MQTDILVVGGGLGGVAAALSAARMGQRVVLTEETDWLGGQLTAQAVPMDEHPWIDRFGCTATYRALRDGVRDYYRRAYPLTAAARYEPDFSPGAALTTRLSCEPRVALSVIEEMLAPFRANGLLTVILRCRPESVDVSGNRIRAVTFRDLEDDGAFTVEAAYMLDATETGDLLPLAGMEYVTGAESAEETGEPHARAGAPEPLDMQGFTYCFALFYRPDEDHTIDRPGEYDFWRSYQAPFETGLHLSWKPREGRAYDYELFPVPGSGKFSLWQYRRILYAGNFDSGYLNEGVSLINSSHNDYWLGPIIEVPQEEAARHRRMARELALSTLYWLQTEAPRPDGGTGYPGLALHRDYTGTRDGLAKYPYVREGRRIVSLRRVTELDVGLDARPDQEAERFPDSVGIGCYNIDLHPTTGGKPSLSIKTRPFQIPLGALLPRDMDNYVAAGKNLGVTHITNGCYRLHSIEWNIGESAGALAAFALERGVDPRSVRHDESHLSDYQRSLARLGIELEWPRPAVGTSYYSAVRDDPEWGWGESDRKRGWAF